MKVTHIKIKNIGIIADQKITIDKPLIIFYGETRQGKTTILNCVRWVLGGSFPADIIRHGAREASIEMAFEGGSISRSFYRSKGSQEVQARPVEFIRDGALVRKPAAEIEKFLNPFLSNQDYLRNMGETDRKLYFAKLFAVDTKDLDMEALQAAKEASELRATLKAYGDIDLTTVDPPPIAALEAERNEIIANHAAEKDEWKKQLSLKRSCHRTDVVNAERANEAVRKRHSDRESCQGAINTAAARIVELTEQIEKEKAKMDANEHYLVKNPELETQAIPNEPPELDELRAKITTLPPVEGINVKIAKAQADQVRYDQYLKNKQREKERDGHEERLLQLERRQKTIKEEKASKLRTVGDESGVPGLAFDEEGSFLYEETAAGMLSTSQLIRLSSALSALYPEGFGIELLDRAESLGRAIFEYVKHAEEHKTTVLATVVGERPAEVPEKVGVFVVKDGCVLDKQPAEEQQQTETTTKGQ
jgi:hypothetical protein